MTFHIIFPIRVLFRLNSPRTFLGQAASFWALEVSKSQVWFAFCSSEALLALPSLTVFKQEAPSPSSQNDAG